MRVSQAQQAASGDAYLRPLGLRHCILPGDRSKGTRLGPVPGAPFLISAGRPAAGFLALE